MRGSFILPVIAVVVGCGPVEPDLSAPELESSSLPIHVRSRPAPASSAEIAELAPHVGHCVRVSGYLTSLGFSPELLTGRVELGVKTRGETEAWMRLTSEGRVEVRGIIREEDDRFVIEDATGSVVRPVADVERDLASAVGTKVALAGMLWSKNGNWWFSYDGVDVHVEAHKGMFDFSAHAKPITLHGELVRKPMPRIDQIGIRSKRDLADAYVILLEKKSPHPGFLIDGC